MKTLPLVTLAFLQYLYLGLAPTFAQETDKEMLKKHPERKDVTGVATEDPEMEAALAKAKGTLKSFIVKLMERDKDKRYLVKVALKEEDEVEHVWLEPVKWNDPGLVGILAVQPVVIKAHKRGDLISPSPADVSDWLILSKDGTKEGGFTEDVIAKRQAEEEAEGKAKKMEKK